MIFPDTRTGFQKFVSLVAQQGRIPQHVAFIMDGNRRYASSQGLKTVYGHIAGENKMKEVITWCEKLGVKETTFYAFSIENFKREQEEVDNIMEILKEGLKEQLSNMAELVAEGYCIQFVGDWSLVPVKLKPMMSKLMLDGRHGKCRINIAFAYTGRNTIVQAVNRIEKGIVSNDLEVEDMSEFLLGEAQWLLPSLPVDVMIRTSGEKRLSDFMMWESTHALLHFMDNTWPEFSFWNLVDAILQWQVHQRRVIRPKVPSLPCASQKRVDKFLEKIRREQWRKLELWAKKVRLAI